MSTSRSTGAERLKPDHPESSITINSAKRDAPKPPAAGWVAGLDAEDVRPIANPAPLVDRA